MQTKVTKRVVDGLEPTDRDYFLWDSDLEGFGVRVMPSGIKTYVVQYRRIDSGASRRMKVGRCAVLTPDEARTRAKKLLGEVADRKDPSADRKRDRSVPTVAVVADRYLREHARVHNKPSMVAEVERLVARHIKPPAKLGSIRITDLTREKVKQWHGRMVGTPYEANRALSCLSKILQLAAVDWGYRADNPARGIRKYREFKRRRYLDAAELAALGMALNEAEEAKVLSVAALNCIRFLAFTGMRRASARNLRWSEVDTDLGVLRLGDSKTGESDLPLAQEALAILKSINHDDEVYVFGGDEPLSDDQLEYVWRQVVEAAEVIDGEGKKTILVDENGKRTVRLHDLRHTVGTYAGRANFNQFIVKDLLGHKTIAMTARYVEKVTDPLREAADAVSKIVAKAMSASRTVEPKEPGDADRA